MALLFVDGYVETDSSNDNYANFTEDTSDLNLFDADSDIYSRINIIRQTSTCSNLLAEFHWSCNPQDNTCPANNLQSYQVSIDDVCEAVNTPKKLYFEAIFDELDGYSSDDGKEHSSL